MSRRLRDNSKQLSDQSIHDTLITDQFQLNHLLNSFFSVSTLLSPYQCRQAIKYRSINTSHCTAATQQLLRIIIHDC